MTPHEFTIPSTSSKSGFMDTTSPGLSANSYVPKLHLVRKHVLKFVLGAVVEVVHAQFDAPRFNCTHYKDSSILVVLVERFNFFARWIHSSGDNLHQGLEISPPLRLGACWFLGRIESVESWGGPWMFGCLYVLLVSCWKPLSSHFATFYKYFRNIICNDASTLTPVKDSWCTLRTKRDWWQAGCRAHSIIQGYTLWAWPVNVMIAATTGILLGANCRHQWSRLFFYLIRSSRYNLKRA